MAQRAAEHAIAGSGQRERFRHDDLPREPDRRVCPGGLTGVGKAPAPLHGRELSMQESRLRRGDRILISCSLRSERQANSTVRAEKLGHKQRPRQTSKKKNMSSLRAALAARKRVVHSTATGKNAPLPSPQTEFPRPEINKRMAVISVPIFDESHPKASIPRLPEGSPGIYNVTFVLTIPGRELFQSELNLPKLIESGESLIHVPRGVSQLNVRISNDVDAVDVLFLPNASGSLAKAQIKVEASSFSDAEKLAYDLVMPIFSWWSFRYDIALDITGYVLEEVETDVTRAVFGVVGKAKELDRTTEGFSKPAYRKVFAAYREALNASNVFYQLLCFYKVIEGVKKLRVSRKDAIFSAGGEYHEPPDEKIPQDETSIPISDPLELEDFKPYLGRKFTWVLEQFRELLRNAVAHLDPEGDSLIADVSADVLRCERGISVIKYISRVMLSNEIQADPDTNKPNVL